MTAANGHIRLSIEGVETTVPEGTLVVNAAKQAGVYIPVFCYHPKLDPVGMCRICLVEIGRPKRDRQSGEFVKDEHGERIIEFGPNLETACTTPVGEGWVVRAASAKALQGQRQIVEYLLTSHPLDCPICDKGGECPLQELTMDFGSGKSRFLYDDKIDLAKAYPLGELITLDRERCIQCARCTRYQEEMVGEPVLGFEQRGRRLQIVTYSDPGFDSYFSGNTTDICPVGALTTNDFRFQARPWELKAAASVCPHCPVGCNTVLNTRRQPSKPGREGGGGRGLVQRVLPRQNERVNEIWICDKGRFAHHYASSIERLARPMLRKEGELAEVSWDEALEAAAAGLKEADTSVVGLIGGRVTNEDQFNFMGLVEGLGGAAFLYDEMGGGDVVQQVGVGFGTDLGQLGVGDAILVIASDLHEEAPIWWYRVRQASRRGAGLVVANARPTALDRYADHLLRYTYPHAVRTALGLLRHVSGRDDLAEFAGEGELRAAAEALSEAENLIIFYGREGLSLRGSQALAEACGGLLGESGHAGRAHNGLIPVWPRANTQGAWEVGLRPAESGPVVALQGASAGYVVAADPAGDNPELKAALEGLDFVVVQDLFCTQTAELADVVLPAQSFVEREGTYTSGERRVQRFYPAVPVFAEARPDWHISAAIGERLGIELEKRAPALVFRRIGQEVEAYAGLNYQRLAEVKRQWPPVGGENLYFGGTAYSNTQGLGAQLAPGAEQGEPFVFRKPEDLGEVAGEGVLLVPTDTLYDRGITVTHTDLLKPRLTRLRLRLHPVEASSLGLAEGDEVEVRWNGRVERLPLEITSAASQGAALVHRGLGVPVSAPVRVEIGPVDST